MSSWDDVSEVYSRVFQTKFGQIYNEMASLARDGINVMDYGTGPGEPATTFIKQYCKDDKKRTVVLYDPSKGMLEIAKRNTISYANTNLELEYSATGYTQFGKFDYIFCSLALMYVEDLPNLLNNLFGTLMETGKLISSHWGYAKNVPSLTIMKIIGREMSRGSKCTADDLSDDATFCLANQMETEKIFKEAEFKTAFKTIQLSTEYSSVLDLVEFTRGAPWYETKKEQVKARIEQLLGEMGIDYSSKFVLHNECVIAVSEKA